MPVLLEIFTEVYYLYVSKMIGLFMKYAHVKMCMGLLLSKLAYCQRTFFDSTIVPTQVEKDTC